MARVKTDKTTAIKADSIGQRICRHRLQKYETLGRIRNSRRERHTAAAQRSFLKEGRLIPKPAFP